MKRKIISQTQKFHVFRKTEKILNHWICLSLWSRNHSLPVMKETNLLLYTSHKLCHKVKKFDKGAKQVGSKKTKLPELWFIAPLPVSSQFWFKTSALSHIGLSVLLHINSFLLTSPVPCLRKSTVQIESASSKLLLSSIYFQKNLLLAKLVLSLKVAEDADHLNLRSSVYSRLWNFVA